jgi:hypothetical protein
VRLTSFFLADHAEAVRGKLYVTGGAWDTLNVRGLPAMHPHMSVCVVLEVGWDDVDVDIELEVKLMDADGRSLLPGKVGGTARAQRQANARPGDTAPLMLVFNLLNTRFDDAGDFNVGLEINRVPVGQIRLKVRHLPASGPGPVT